MPQRNAGKICTSGGDAIAFLFDLSTPRFESQAQAHHLCLSTYSQIYIYHFIVKRTAINRGRDS